MEANIENLFNPKYEEIKLQIHKDSDCIWGSMSPECRLKIEQLILYILNRYSYNELAGLSVNFVIMIIFLTHLHYYEMTGKLFTNLLFFKLYTPYDPNLGDLITEYIDYKGYKILIDSEKENCFISEYLSGSIIEKIDSYTKATPHSDLIKFIHNLETFQKASLGCPIYYIILS
jgi:hypothetical protein